MKPLQCTMANQVTLHRELERLMYGHKQEILFVVPHRIYPHAGQGLYPLDISEYKIIHRDKKGKS
jgi:hypothetical protein